jgi:hypothetical protein
MSDRRGFKYPLEPLRTLCELDLTRLRGDLARASSQVQAQQEAVTQLNDQLELQCAEARDSSPALPIELRRMQHAHVHRVAETLRRAEADLQCVEQERDGVVQASMRLTRFRDGVEKHRGGQLAEFDRAASARELRDADDQWLAARGRSMR